MSLLIAAVVSGIALGFLLGLLGFGIVFLYKATGVANFAQGVLGTFGAFLVYRIGLATGLGPWISFLLGLVVSLPAGALMYALVFRPKDEADKFNLTVRTLGLNLLLLALIERYWAAGQPFAFPAMLPQTAALNFGQTVISWLTLGTIAIAALLAVGFAALFRYTDLGLLFLALSERPEIARMLGVATRRLTMVGWMLTAGIALIVGVLLAPAALLSSEMMEPYMLLGFTAVVLGGLTSLFGVFVGGILVGIVNNVVTLYANGDMAVFAVFGLLLIVLGLRPQGLFGVVVPERL